MCAAGLRAVAGTPAGAETRRAVGRARRRARRLGRPTTACTPTGRWQRSPDDPAVDAALLLPAIRGAVRSRRPAQRRDHRRGASRSSPTTATSTASATTRRPAVRGRGRVRALRLPHGAGQPRPGRPRGAGALVRTQPRPPADHRACSPRSTTSSSASCAATSLRPSSTPCSWRPPNVSAKPASAPEDSRHEPAEPATPNINPIKGDPP